jgi:hypothetical protein
MHAPEYRIVAPKSQYSYKALPLPRADHYGYHVPTLATAPETVVVRTFAETTGVVVSQRRAE